MATFSTADEPPTRPDDWHEPPAEPDVRMQDEPASVPRPLSERIRAELWQPRYVVLAGIIVLLIVLQVWILF